jgi:succinate dehydrogenase hydrophobic anchor subunit
VQLLLAEINQPTKTPGVELLSGGLYAAFLFTPLLEFSFHSSFGISNIITMYNKSLKKKSSLFSMVCCPYP